MLELISMPDAEGIICVSYLLWFFLWIVLYGVLGGRESVGTLPVWTAIVLGATLLSILIVEVSFAWRLLAH
jgi:hypothetical protein